MRLCPLLAEAIVEFEAYERLLREWQPRINLVSNTTLPELWSRHFADSAQLAHLLPGAMRWADLGSGAGFPGMVLAILLKRRLGAKVHLIESDQRKASFLRAVSRETGAAAIVHCGRIDVELPKLVGEVEAISARALAPLPLLIDWSKEHLLKSSVGVFLKGENWRSELTEAKREPIFDFSEEKSVTNAAARIILVRKSG